MKAVICKPGVDKPEIIELPDNEEAAFKEMQKLVGGYLERIRAGKFDIYCDEDGNPKQLPPNRPVAGRLLVGTFVVVKNKPGTFDGLTDNEATWLVNDLSPGGCLLLPLS